MKNYHVIITITFFNFFNVYLNIKLKNKDYFTINGIDSTNYIDEDFGYADSDASYRAHLANNYDYNHYTVIQTKHDNYFNITVVSPRLPYFVTEQDVIVLLESMYSNVFKFTYKKSMVFPFKNIGLYDYKTLTFSDFSIYVTPKYCLNYTDPDFTYNVKINNKENIDTTDTIIITQLIIDIKYACTTKKLTKLYSNDYLIDVKLIKSKSEKELDNIKTKSSTSANNINHIDSKIVTNYNNDNLYDNIDISDFDKPIKKILKSLQNIPLGISD